MDIAVYFFGGYHASQHDIDAWLRSARVLKPHIDFTGYPWPSGANSDAKSAVEVFSRNGHYDAVVEEVRGSAERIYIVGHSSGCAIANAVDAGIEYVENVVLVSLDGFRPSAYQLERETTQVWGADCDGVLSRNYPGLAQARRQIFHAKNCKTEWALHFSLVNANASDALVDSVEHGYANCKANLLFL